MRISDWSSDVCSSDLGSVRTPMLRGFVGDDEAALDAMGRSAPMRRLGEPTEIAQAIVWLLSDAASYVTGEPLRPDGGVDATNCTRDLWSHRHGIRAFAPKIVRAPCREKGLTSEEHT